MADDTLKRSNPVGRDVLPQEGSVQFENGEIIFRDRRGNETGRLFNSKTGPMLDGVFSVVQREDAAEIRVGAYYDDGVQGGGKVSFNRIKRDGMQEELGYLSISHVDNPTGDDRGQFKAMLRTHHNADHMEPFIIATTAYSEEKFGRQTLWVGVKNMVRGLWKFEPPGTVPEPQDPSVDPPSPPPVLPPPPPPPPAPTGFTYLGFRQGDWAALRAAGPVEDTDEPAYNREPTAQRWIAFVDKMMRRR